MSGYTVFLGPFAGIMVTDVRPHYLITIPSTCTDLHVASTGSSTAAKSTCRRCTTPTAGTGTHTASYVPLPPLSVPPAQISLTLYVELACGRRDPRFSAADVPGADQRDQPEHTSREGLASVRHRLDIRGALLTHRSFGIQFMF